MSFVSSFPNVRNLRVEREGLRCQNHTLNLETVAPDSYAANRYRTPGAAQVTSLNPGSANPVLLPPGRTALNIGGSDWNSDTRLRSEYENRSSCNGRRVQARFEVHLDRSQAAIELDVQEVRVKISPALPPPMVNSGPLPRAHQVQLLDGASSASLLPTVGIPELGVELAQTGDALFLSDGAGAPLTGTQLNSILAAGANVAVIRGELDYQTF